MEVRCPQCAQRLRYADSLQNPLLRCRSCGTQFRPAELNDASERIAQAVDDDAAASRPAAFEEYAAESPPVTSTPPKPAASSMSRGIGSIGFIVMLILFKAGPKLVREFQRDRRPKQPVQFRPNELRRIDKLPRNPRADAANQPELPPVRREF